MALTAELLILALVINRLVELFKESLPLEDAENPRALDRWRTLIILLVSFVLGAAAVIFVFPTQNLFPGAASQLAGQVFTGIVVGGFANGFDWLAGLGESLINRVEPARVQTVTSTVQPPARVIVSDVSTPLAG